MEPETKIELTLDVYGWCVERERIMREIEVGIYRLFLDHKGHTDQTRRTGCFYVTLALPKYEPLPDLNTHPTGPECTESCLHGFGCKTPVPENTLNCTIAHNCASNYGAFCNGAPRI